MHHISKITIKNYKSIKDAEFPLSPYSPLVGYNNAGKTNILKALNWVIKKAFLPKSDFNNHDKPVIVEVEICGITEDVLNAMGDNKNRKTIDSPEYIVAEKIRIRRVQEKEASSSKDIRLEILSTKDNEKPTWEPNPNGIDNAISHLFPDPIFIGAMENATEDIEKNAAGTTIGKLIKAIIDPVTKDYTPEVKKALENVSKKISANGSKKDPKLKKIDVDIDSVLANFFHGVSVKIHIPTPEFSDFVKNATIRIFEEGNKPEGQNASSFGHGTQRAMQIALIKYLAEIKKNDAQTAQTGRTTLILIDEPELYLHPQAIELVRSSLNTLASEGYQVIFTTHSANMIAREDAANALLIRRNSTAGTVARKRIQDAVSEQIKNTDTQAKILFELTNATKILFSEEIVLAEGKTENTIFPEIYKHRFKKTLAEDKIGLVALGGSGNVPNAMKVLQAMGIPVKAVVDLDFAFKVKIDNELTEATKNDIAECKKISARLCKDGVIDTETSGLPTKGNNMSTADAFALMAKKPDAKPYIQNLHECLLKKDIWLWKRGTIETQLGIKKNDDDYHNFIKNLENTNIEKEVEEMLDWLNPTETTE